MALASPRRSELTTPGFGFDFWIAFAETMGEVGPLKVQLETPRGLLTGNSGFLTGMVLAVSPGTVDEAPSLDMPPVLTLGNLRLTLLPTSRRTRQQETSRRHYRRFMGLWGRERRLLWGG